ncbi:hypothetical protein E2C01_081516 [Portunus trituberculatus]|uniref:Uncharacterized protein n=1 Tax=Portunus trituberculatus TaxID=210409 RepID=A0A5B7IPZ5_PORTR|nr:hypothetical protein [Portunus trituberculatus]
MAQLSHPEGTAEASGALVLHEEEKEEEQEEKEEEEEEEAQNQTKLYHDSQRVFVFFSLSSVEYSYNTWEANLQHNCSSYMPRHVVSLPPFTTCPDPLPPN